MTIERSAISKDPRNLSESERLVRLKAAWQADKPSPAEILRARTRWVIAQGRPRPPRPRFPALVMVAVLVGAAGAFAATGTLRWTSAGVESQATSVSVPTPTVSPQRVAPIPVPVPAPAPAGAFGALPESSSRAVSPGPRAPGAGRKLRSSGAWSQAPAPPPGLLSTPQELQAHGAGAWQRAADALRQGDDQQATQALQELATSSDPYTRDTAALAKAQLEVAAGRWDRALPVLQQIAVHGATPLLRRRASEVLAQRP